MSTRLWFTQLFIVLAAFLSVHLSKAKAYDMSAGYDGHFTVPLSVQNISP